MNFKMFPMGSTRLLRTGKQNNLKMLLPKVANHNKAFYPFTYTRFLFHTKTNENVSAPQIVEDDSKSISELTVPGFPEVIVGKKHEVLIKPKKPDSKLKDATYTQVARVARLFTNIENYNNHWETAMLQLRQKPKKMNVIDDKILTEHGPEWALGDVVLRLGGALKLVTDDRWIDDLRRIRTPKQKDFTVEAVDLRHTIINHDGLKHLENVGYLRYLNIADCHLFDKTCMSCLFPVADTLEYLDISGTNVSPEGFSYLRLFPRLKWINLSRLPNPELMDKMLPFIADLLPPDCIVITNDDMPSTCYGSEIPFRSLKDPVKDLLLDNVSGIGDVTIFNEMHGANKLQLSDVTHVHKLWKTPALSKQRKLQMTRQHNYTNNPIPKMVKYLKKAEQYEPLL